MHKTLHVIATVFNPWRYKSRIKLYREFEKYVTDSGAELWTVELAHGRRDWEVTQRDNPHHLRLRSRHELWHKESMTNLGIQQLPRNWKYVAWVDADVTFARPDWVEETVQLLQHYPVLQLFSETVDLSPHCTQLKRHLGLVWAYQEGLFDPKDPRYETYHPGFAWAARREAIDQLGGLFDVALLGSADRHMALSLLGLVHHSHPPGLSLGYREALDLWESRAEQHIRRNVGCVPGLLLHHWHGKKVHRRYRDRWKILTENQFDPEFDLKKDWQGLWQYTGNKPRLEYDVRRYFAARNEDSIDVE